MSRRRIAYEKTSLKFCMPRPRMCFGDAIASAARHWLQAFFINVPSAWILLEMNLLPLVS